MYIIIIYSSIFNTLISSSSRFSNNAPNSIPYVFNNTSSSIPGAKISHIACISRENDRLKEFLNNNYHVQPEKNLINSGIINFKKNSKNVKNLPFGIEENPKNISYYNLIREITIIHFSDFFSEKSNNYKRKKRKALSLRFQILLRYKEEEFRKNRSFYSQLNNWIKKNKVAPITTDI